MMHTVFIAVQYSKISGCFFVEYFAMNKKISFKGIWKVLKNCFKGVGEDKIVKLSASLAYYTVFSLGPLLLVVVFLASIFFEKEAVEGSLFSQMQSFIGKDAAMSLQGLIQNAAVSGSENIAAIIGIVTLLVGATTVFADMQDSINTIWGLKAKPKSGIWQFIKVRLLSFGVIASLGFLLLVSLGISALIDSFSGNLQEIFPGIAFSILYIINLVITFIIISSLFLIIFKVLPDAQIRWKDILSGAITTALLFMLGKFAISFYISKSNLGDTYGAAGSIVVLLVWIYYSSIILYFGAEFTKAFAMEYGNAIHPKSYAVVSKKVDVEDGKDSVQDADKKIETKQQLK